MVVPAKMSEKPYEVRWGILGEFFFLSFSVAGLSEVSIVLMDLFILNPWRRRHSSLSHFRSTKRDLTNLFFFFLQQRAG